MKTKAFGDIETPVMQQIERCLAVSGDGARAVLCADNHRGYGMPIGGVVASQTHVMPAGVGYDIGCGNLAVRTNLYAKDIDVSAVMDEIVRRQENCNHPMGDDL